jgi:hypothetical protein
MNCKPFMVFVSAACCCLARVAAQLPTDIPSEVQECRELLEDTDDAISEPGHRSYCQRLMLQLVSEKSQGGLTAFDRCKLKLLNPSTYGSLSEAEEVECFDRTPDPSKSLVESCNAKMNDPLVLGMIVCDYSICFSLLLYSVKGPMTEAERRTCFGISEREARYIFPELPDFLNEEFPKHAGITRCKRMIQTHSMTTFNFITLKYCKDLLIKARAYYLTVENAPKNATHFEICDNTLKSGYLLVTPERDRINPEKLMMECQSCVYGTFNS